MSKRRTPPPAEAARRGGKRTQEVLAGSVHPLSANNFWGGASKRDRQRHALALSARRRAHGACLAVALYQGACPLGKEAADPAESAAPTHP